MFKSLLDALKNIADDPITRVCSRIIIKPNLRPTEDKGTSIGATKGWITRRSHGIKGNREHAMKGVRDNFGTCDTENW